MKKIATLCAVVGVSALLAACTTHKKIDNNIVGSYVLVAVNDQPIPNSIPPVLNISRDSSITTIQLNGKMCNVFNGQAIYQNGVLKAADGVAMTRVFCDEPTLNQLDTVIGDMLRKGAYVEKANGQLVLRTTDNTLVYEQQDLPMTQKDNTR